MNPVEYHDPSSCNKCKGNNEFIKEVYDSGILHEAETRCETCGFQDYWAYGFFESGSEMVSNCRKYSFNNEQE